MEFSLIRHSQLQHEDSQTTITAHILQLVSHLNEMSHTHQDVVGEDTETRIINYMKHTDKDGEILSY